MFILESAELHQISVVRVLFDVNPRMKYSVVQNKMEKVSVIWNSTILMGCHLPSITKSLPYTTHLWYGSILTRD
jgi:hypothetical protein